MASKYFITNAVSGLSKQTAQITTRAGQVSSSLLGTEPKQIW